MRLVLASLACALALSAAFSGCSSLADSEEPPYKTYAELQLDSLFAILDTTQIGSLKNGNLVTYGSFTFEKAGEPMGCQSYEEAEEKYANISLPTTYDDISKLNDYERRYVLSNISTDDKIKYTIDRLKDFTRPIYPLSSVEIDEINRVIPILRDMDYSSATPTSLSNAINENRLISVFGRDKYILVFKDNIHPMSVFYKLRIIERSA